MKAPSPFGTFYGMWIWVLYKHFRETCMKECRTSSKRSLLKVLEVLLFSFYSSGVSLFFAFTIQVLSLRRLQEKLKKQCLVETEGRLIGWGMGFQYSWTFLFSPQQVKFISTPAEVGSLLPLS